MRGRPHTLAKALEAPPTTWMTLDVGSRAQQAMDASSPTFLAQCLANLAGESHVKGSGKTRGAGETSGCSAVCPSDHQLQSWHGPSPHRSMTLTSGSSNAIGSIRHLLEISHKNKGARDQIEDIAHPYTRDAETWNSDCMPHVVSAQQLDLLLARQLRKQLVRVDDRHGD